MLEGKTVDVGARIDRAEAQRILRESVERYRAQAVRLRSGALPPV